MTPQTETAAATSLTPRERILNALTGKPVDRVPVWMMRQAGRYMPEYQKIRKQYDFLSLCKTPSAAAEVSLQPIEIIDSDAVIIFNDILVPLEIAGGKVRFGDGGPKIDNPLRAKEDLSDLKGRKVSDDEPIAETIGLVRDQVGADFPILGFIGAPWTLASYWIEGVMTKNFENILKMRWSNPALLDQILEMLTEVATDYLRLQIKAGANAVQIFDTWGTMLQARDYDHFSGRWIRKIIESVSDLGVPVIVYVNGCAPYIDQLAKMGATCLSVDWRLGLAEAKEHVGDGMSLQGNIDPLVLYSNPEAINKAVAELFEGFPPGTGHVFNLGHGILPKTPVENARELIKAVKRHGTC